MWQKTKVFMTRLIEHLSIKWDQPLWGVIDYVLTSLNITCVRATHCIIWGPHIPVKDMSYILPIFEDEAGMSSMC